jgi:hypothetical protein
MGVPIIYVTASGARGFRMRNGEKERIQVFAEVNALHPGDPAYGIPPGYCDIAGDDVVCCAQTPAIASLIGQGILKVVENASSATRAAVRASAAKELDAVIAKSRAMPRPQPRGHRQR